MGPKDFKIGNWISCEDGYFQIEELCKLSKDSLNQNIGARYRNGSFWTDCNDIQPVRLNPEWIGRFGGKLRKGFDSLYDIPIIGHSIKQIAISYSDKYLITSAIAEYSEKQTITKAMNYVHELQNFIYTLTEKDPLEHIDPKQISNTRL